MRYLASGLAALLIVLSVTAALSNGDMLLELRDTRELMGEAVSSLNSRLGNIRSYLSGCQCWRGKAYRELRRETNAHTASNFAIDRCYKLIDDAGRAENAGNAKDYRRAMRKLERLYRSALKRLYRSYQRFPEGLPDDDLARNTFCERIMAVHDAFENLFDDEPRVRGYPLDCPSSD